MQGRRAVNEKEGSHTAVGASIAGGGCGAAVAAPRSIMGLAAAAPAARDGGQNVFMVAKHAWAAVAGSASSRYVEPGGGAALR